jgi:hypothetical protein
MPRRVRQRIVFCDCLDCQELAPGLDNFDWEAAAKQLPPPRSLMLLLEGFNHSVSSDVSDECCSLDRFVLPHFDNVARQGVTFCAAQPKGEKLFFISDCGQGVIRSCSKHAVVQGCQSEHRCPTHNTSRELALKLCEFKKMQFYLINKI